ncbi:MAG: hypothetical protein WC371_03970 [Parachlamydiales bacterium]|jgi:hypothetical protein
MEMLSIYLAKLLGLYFLIMGLAIFFKTSHYQKSLKEMGGSDALMTVISIMPLVVGLSIVLGHNLWVDEWPVLITILGWLLLVKGLIRLFCYKTVMKKTLKIAEKKSFLKTAGLVLGLIGLILCYLGFASS